LVLALKDITETDLPGIGKRFAITTASGETVTVISHLTGRRDIYHSASEDKEPYLLTLTDEEARQLSAILGDTFFRPTPMDMLRSALASKAYIDMARLPAGSPAVGASLKQLDVRRQTGATVLAIQRGDEMMANPPATTLLEGDDVLIVLGMPEDMKKLERLLQNG
jgi:TrkA domain protein